MKIKIPCNCICHRQNGIVHFQACCNNGYNEIEVVDLKDLSEEELNKLTKNKKKDE